MHKKSIHIIINVLLLCLIIGVTSIFFVQYKNLIGPSLIALGLLCLLSLIPFKIKLKSAQPDIIFGIIDNGFLAIFSIFGGHFAGITGAILGGIAGNAITDGIAGIFEGYWAEKLRAKNISEERTVLTSAVGKMAGCLLGAGVVFLIADLFQF